MVIALVRQLTRHDSGIMRHDGEYEGLDPRAKEELQHGDGVSSVG